MSGYIGTQPVPQATQTRDTFTATAGQTSFATAGYTPSFLDVFLNGVHLQNGTDYTASNGSDVVLTTGAALDDVLEVVAYSTFDSANTYNRSEADAEFVNDPNDVITVNGSNVGIGTSSPEEKLHVEGSLKVDFGSAGGNPRVYLDHDSATDDGNYLQLNRGDDGLEVVGQDNVKIRTNGSERMRIDSSGRVGIGTTSPGANFDLRGNASIGPTNTSDAYQGMSFVQGKDSSVANTTSYIDFKNNLSTSDAHVFADHLTDGSSELIFGTTPAGSRSTDRRAERMRIDGSGNVGINTSSPAQALHVQDAGTNATGTIKLGNDYHGFVQQHNNDLNIISNGDQAYRVAAGTNNGTGNIVFQTANGTTGNTQRMRIDSLGRVTMPYQPCFSASGSGLLTWSSGSTITKIVPLTYVPQNVGGYFNASTYRFTAPVAGNYFFSAKATQTGTAIGPSLFLYKNNAVHGFEMAIGYSVAYHSFGGEVIIPLATNDYVDMRITNNNSQAMNIDKGRCSLSGFLIG